jgi:hypothetical protein
VAFPNLRQNFIQTRYLRSAVAQLQSHGNTTVEIHSPTINPNTQLDTTCHTDWRGCMGRHLAVSWCTHNHLPQNSNFGNFWIAPPSFRWYCIRFENDERKNIFLLCFVLTFFMVTVKIRSHFFIKWFCMWLGAACHRTNTREVHMLAFGNLDNIRFVALQYSTKRRYFCCYTGNPSITTIFFSYCQQNGSIVSLVHIFCMLCSKKIGIFNIFSS